MSETRRIREATYNKLKEKKKDEHTKKKQTK